MPWNVSKYSHGSKLLVDIFDVHPQLGGAISHDDEDEILIKLISNYNCWTVGLLVNLFVESGSWFSLVASSINLFSVIPSLHVSSFAFNLFSTLNSRFALAVWGLFLHLPLHFTEFQSWINRAGLWKLLRSLVASHFPIPFKNCKQGGEINDWA